MRCSTALVVLGLGLCTLASVTAPRAASAQWTFEPRVSVVGQYSFLLDVHEWQENIRNQIQRDVGVPAKSVTRFPIRPGVRVDAVLIESGAAHLGAGVGYVSTAGRVAYNDYSGDFYLDQILERWHVAVFDEHRLSGGGSAVSTWASVRVLLAHTAVDLEQTTRIGSSEQRQTQTFSTYSFGVEPAIEVQRSISPLLLRLRVGVEVSWSRPLHDDGETLYVDRDDKLNVNWSGARVGLTLAYPFP